VNQLAALLHQHYQRSPYRSIAALAKAARVYGPISQSYVKELLRGSRLHPSHEKLLCLAQALDLSQEETNQLMEAAGLPPAGVESHDAGDPQVEQILDAFKRLRSIPDLPPQSLQAVVNGLLLLIEGVRGVANATMSHAASSRGSPAASTRPLSFPPSASLGPVPGLVDDLLGEILSHSSDHPLDTLFTFLAEAARGNGWEIKRRIAEALPRLVELQPEATLQLAAMLRTDYHPDWEADIRRRVVEAVPTLHRYRPQEALGLLSFRDGDEIYTALAIVEALDDLESTGRISVQASDRYFAALRLDDPTHKEVISFLRRLLLESRENPDAALFTMRSTRDSAEKLFKICTVRTVPRLLRHHPNHVLDLLAHFARRDENGNPAEHKNVRRPIAKASREIADFLEGASPDLKDKAGQLFQALARDPDVHVRRALGDALPRLAVTGPDLAMGILDILVEDPDAYVRQRAGRALLKLASLYPDQARSYYVALLGSDDRPIL